MNTFSSQEFSFDKSYFKFFRWQDYEANLGSGFRELRKDNEFMDVTLCCDNGVDKVQAHKLILVS